METQEQIASLLEGILSELQSKRMSDDLWTVEDIARYAKKGVPSVRSHLVYTPGFPKPIKTPANRWMAKEVKAWFMKQR